MNELEKIDDSTYYDPQTGETFLSIEYAWEPSNQERKQNIVRELGKAIESLVLIRLGTDYEVSTLNVDQYFDRIKAYRPAIIREDGSYSDFCNAIADEVLQNWGMYKRTMGVYLTDINKVKVSYSQEINEAVEELIEYRTLAKIRSHLNEGDLIKHLHKIFMKEVLTSASVSSKGIIENLEAELSLCLTDSEKKDQLRDEYKSRLETLKEKAELSELAYAGLNFEYLPWQCFTSKYLERACYDLVIGYSFNNRFTSDNIQFDLTLINWWLIHRYAESHRWPKNKTKEETSQLAAEWLVIEWIKSEINSDQSINSATVDEPKAKPSICTENVFNPPIHIETARKHFIQLAETNSRNGKPFLSVKEVDEFISRAFTGKPFTEKLTINERYEKAEVIGLFHLFYKDCDTYQTRKGKIDPNATHKKYIQLLTNHFDNWTFEKVKDNFRSGGNWKGINDKQSLQ